MAEEDQEVAALSRNVTPRNQGPRGRTDTDASTITRQGSAGGRSIASSGGRTDQSSPVTDQSGVKDSGQKIKELEDELERVGKTAHILDSVVHAEDLSATWEDMDKGFTDWRQCRVDGSHLKEPEDAPDPAGFQAEGAQGEVLRATWKSSIKVAIKKNLNPEIENEKELKLFIELHHPHVVACYGILKDSDSKSDCIVTERCRTSLEAFLKKEDEWKDKEPGMLDMMKYTIIQHVALGLQKLHDMNVLHRDIKANNILLDGAPGTCQTCDHSGNWKICDFGEASVLQTPKLNFSKPQEWPRGWSDSLNAQKRFQPITSPYLRGLGARHYCWLLPGERLQSSPDHVEPPTAREDNGEWTPCEHGGFVYSFNEDPKLPSADDCFFDVSGGDDKAAHAEATSFPASLGPFNLNPTELLPEIDFKKDTYRLRSVTHRDPQLEKLKNFGVKIKGKISPIAQVTLPQAARRAVMIPEDATHFVWAYQGVDLEELDATQAKELDATSPEVNFVSLGGFVYLKDVEWGGEDGKTVLSADVCRANAIALEGSTCRSGTINRHECGKPDCNPELPHRCDDGNWCDNGVTAAVASPELFDGVSIGLETDIYAFGIVMWEVFTRRQAWEWFTGPEKDQSIMMAVALDRRPRMPDGPGGLSPDCASWMRRCLHKDPAHRPVAKQITGWISRCRKKVEAGINAQVKEKISESQLNKGLSAEKFANCGITEKDNLHWSNRGRFSLHTSKLTTGTNAGFSLEVVECTLDQWMENALIGDEDEPAPLGKLAKIKMGGFGLKFEKQDGHGGKEKTWPKVTHCDLKDKAGLLTIAAEFPSITPGCLITKINGNPTPPTFKAALIELKKRPLALEFTVPVAESTETVKPWIRAALLEIGLVHRHETAKLLRHRQSMCGHERCSLPHCEDRAASCECSQHAPDRCPIARTNSRGWIQLAERDVDKHTAAEKAAELQKRLFRALAKDAALDAFRDSIATLRAHEERPQAMVPEGDPPEPEPEQ